MLEIIDIQKDDTSTGIYNSKAYVQEVGQYLEKTVNNRQRRGIPDVQAKSIQASGLNVWPEWIRP